MNLAEIIVKNHSLCWHAIYQAQLAVVAHCDSQNRNVAREKEQFFQTQLVRDLFFNPFHPVPTIDPAWLEWRNGTVSQIANGIYQDEGLDQLPIVADALEEAGCTNALLINHLRSPGPHFRGCWALDLILGKQ